MLAEIITIGDEILIGQIVDTNSAWMAQELNRIGLRVKQISSVSDDRQHILKALDEAKARAAVILITGGLGPTKDDITKNTLAAYFGVDMVENAEALANVEDIFRRYNRPLLAVNKLQAQVPGNCEVITNRNGTAPGMWFNEGGVIYVSMPGVPHEMMYMMEESVLPRLKAELSLPFIYHKTILTVGEGESFLAERIADIEDSLPPFIKLAYLPKLGQVRLRLSGYGDNEDVVKRSVEEFAGRITERVRDFVAAQEDIPLERAIMNFMEGKGLTLGLAESCTGGYVASLFTQHAGASKVFKGAIVAYSNDVKSGVLGVSLQTIDNYGAVSEQTASEMAAGALRLINTSYAISITGIAGPGGGTPEKPVGTVCIAVANHNKTVTKKLTFGNKRRQNIDRSAITALNMLNTLLHQSEK